MTSNRERIFNNPNNPNVTRRRRRNRTANATREEQESLNRYRFGDNAEGKKPKGSEES